MEGVFFVSGRSFNSHLNANPLLKVVGGEESCSFLGKYFAGEQAKNGKREKGKEKRIPGMLFLFLRESSVQPLSSH